MMKSIVEEASSLEKAITNAWKRAGNPKKFTITVFQEPEKNFFGMTKAPAKIGLMFEEQAHTQKQPKRHQNRPQAAQTEIADAPQLKQAKSAQPRTNAPQVAKSPVAQKPAEGKNINRFWTQEMIDAARTWVTDTLKIINKESISFSVKPNRYHLKIQFSSPLSSDEKKQKNIFRSFAHLMMQSQRSQFKKPFKHHKVILMDS